MHPKAADWETFNASFLKKTRLDLNQYKANQLQRRILSMADAKGHKSLDELWAWLNADPSNVNWFLDRVAINVSELFRNPAKWDELRDKVLPDLLSRSANLKCWSAGCSYGAEAHSLSMVFQEWFPGSHSIHGTDIDEAALAQAKSGTFNASDVRCVPPALVKKYLCQEGDGWHALPNIKGRLRFSKQNLLGDRFDTGFDLILCRNVVIYFTEAAKNELYQKFFDALKPGGYLLVGGTERIFNASSIGYETPIPFFYKKPIIGESQWQNAS